ncbi:protein transport protein bet1 [Friedmanniomyces endolithicus]|uniref:Protein transport protein bet1 n=1 Tax=Friedmanniomyces endolithicus TaxID=329885 RepID=A0AAN6FAN9_9PEZI|nr:protein transport protein bet1 [Friedmanniomyces endolithicus]KAK0286564.1 protein transport protein bet1 [Friedmanniomyces endolithicus]KAK0310329.1 protein transport protein bet1 [Friedmanniomyces endolithicus]KAK0982981.1 protein transport protein bet1 [Friedmanniomyces endolithicus]
MASRFQRDSRNALFSNYDAQTRSRPSSAAANPTPRSNSKPAPYSTFHANNSSPYAFNTADDSLSAPPSGAGFSAYPGSGDGGGSRRSGEGDGGFRSATPNKRGQYSDAVIDELESQNDEQVSEMSKKVRMLKDVSASTRLDLLRGVEEA